MESGDERHAWVNTTFFIRQGRILPELGVEYRVWRPESSSAAPGKPGRPGATTRSIG